MAQKNKKVIDSLERLTATQKGMALAEIYNELTWQYRTVHPSKAMDYGNKALALATALKYDKSIAQAYNDMGILLMDKQSFSEALSYFDHSLSIRKKLNDDKGMAAIYLKQGIIHQKTDDWDKALEASQNALRIYEKIGFEFGQGTVLNNIGIINYRMGNLDASNEYLLRSIAIKERINDNTGLMQPYVSIGNNYITVRNYAGALKYFEKAKILASQASDEPSLSVIYNNLASACLEMGHLQQALIAVEQSYNIRQKNGDRKGLVSNLAVWGDAYFRQKQFNLAEQKFLKGLELADTFKSCLAEKGTILKKMQEMYVEMHDAQKALKYGREYNTIADSIRSDKMASRFAEMETRFQTTEKQRLIEQQKAELTKRMYDLSQTNLNLSQAKLQIAENELSIKSQTEIILQQRIDSIASERRIQTLNEATKLQTLKIDNQNLELNNQRLDLNNQKLLNQRKTTLLRIFAGVALLTLMLGYSYYRRYQIKQEAKLQKELYEQREEATKNLIEVEGKERSRIAAELHDGVGQMMSAAKMNLSALKSNIQFSTPEQEHAFESVLNQIDDSCKEVRHVSHAMMPGALERKGLVNAVEALVNNITNSALQASVFHEGFEQRADENTEVVLYRIIQECVNNAIKHSGASRLDISMIKDTDHISITIEDNGRGFDKSGTLNDGIGMKNLYTRVNYLKGSIDIDTAPGRGTCIVVEVPALG